MKVSSIFSLFLLVSISYAFEAVPLIVASHKLGKGLKKEISGSDCNPHSSQEATNMLKKLITDCSSDEYLIINQPGLRLSDVNDMEKGNWPHLYKYLTLSSTVVGLPWVDEALDLEYLQQYIIRTCRAEVENVDHEDELEVNYIDSKTRVIRIELSPLPPVEDLEARRLEIRHHDLLIRKILRKLPSPHYTIILTATTTGSYHPLPDHIIESIPQRFQVFDSIVNDPLRKVEIERNDRFHRPPVGQNPAPNMIDEYLQTRKKNEVHLFSRQTWEKNEKIIASIVVAVTAIFMHKVYSKFSGKDKRE